MSEEKKIYQLVNTNPSAKVKGGVISQNRILVGRSESCNIVIPVKSVSAIHAVVEIGASGGKVYDMNSTNGTFVNGKRVITQSIKMGDTISFGDNTFRFEEYSSEDMPPVLDMLAADVPLPTHLDVHNLPQLGDGQIKRAVKGIFKAGPEKAKAPTGRMVYPLAADPKAEFSEYIFEDLDTLYPIFQYHAERSAVEVIILFQDRVYSVDYLPYKNQNYRLVASKSNNNQVEFPYLARGSKEAFITIKNGDIQVQRPVGFESMYLSATKNQVGDESCGLEKDDILIFHKGDLKIFVRSADAPPSIAPAPMFRRDKILRHYIWLLYAAVIFFVVFVNAWNIDEEVEKEKVPERVASILYKQRRILEKPKEVVVQKAPEVKQVQPEQPKTIEKPKPIEEPKVEQPKVVQKKPEVATPGVKNAKKVITKPLKATTTTPDKTQKKLPIVDNRQKNPEPKKPGGAGSPTKTAPKLSNVQSKTQGPVDVYKAAPNMQSSLNNLLAKGGSVTGAKAAGESAGTGSGFGNVAGTGTAGSSDNLERAKVAQKVGSLVGASSGTLEASKGAEGLVDKRGIITAGLPGETVVLLGSMDPDIIRRILMEHLSQFRYCYQKELNKAPDSFSGVINLAFSIGASGHVTKAGLGDGSDELPSTVSGCVLDVLRGIKFPEPKGGGIVEVRQPMNFFEKK
jgi:hypothetical protein